MSYFNQKIILFVIVTLVVIIGIIIYFILKKPNNAKKILKNYSIYRDVNTDKIYNPDDVFPVTPGNYSRYLQPIPGLPFSLTKAFGYIINKNGTINMELYNFIYYKTIIPIDEYLNCFKHNYHYLSGLHTVIDNKRDDSSTSLIKDKLNDFEEKLGNYFKLITDTKINRDDNANANIHMIPIQPFNINSINTDKNTASSFFSFLF